MREKLRAVFTTKTRVFAEIVATLWAVSYFALGAAIFKLMWNTSPASVIVGAVVAFIPLATETLNLFIFKIRFCDVAIIVASFALFLGHFFFFLFVLSKLNYFFIAGTPYFIFFGLALALAFLIFLFPKFNKTAKRITAAVLTAVILVIGFVGLFNATPFYVSGGATVFWVEDEYQIAFATSHRSVGAVEIDGKIYYDATDGENNVSTLHKISVPCEALDGAKKYSVFTQSVAVNTAYLPSKGAKIKKDYDFRPIDESDGIQIYNLSDTHECVTGPAKAAKYFGDKLDLLILNGDIINDVSSEYQISLIYKLAHRVTQGRVPVLYTRGNHECNGKLAADLRKYVGCAERGFYFNIKIGNTLSLLVLDTNNDMGDDNNLIKPIANFDTVRAEQSEWIKSVENWNEGVSHAFVIAHMAYPLSGYQKEKCSWHGWAKELVELTNGKTDLALCGHSHKTDYAEVGTDDNKVADFPVLRGSIRSDKYNDREGVSPFEFTGTAIEINGNTVNVKFTNSKKEVKKEFNLLFR